MKTQLTLPKNFEDAKTLLWINKAASKDDTRPALKCIYVDGKNIVATDGQRLHLAELNEVLELENGFYNLTTKGKELTIFKVDINATYPDYNRMLSFHSTDTDEYKKLETKGFEVSKYKGTVSSSICAVIMATQALFNIELLLDALSIDAKFTVYQKDALSPALFVNCTKKAIIMPMRR